MLKEQLELLIEIEKTASDTYARAAEFFSEDRDFAVFIRRLGNDERLHEEMLLGALGAFTFADPPQSVTYIDSAEMRAIRERFARVSAVLDSGGLAKNDLLEFIIDAEYSEWNDFFLYIIATLKMKNEFKRAAVNIQKHKKAIEEFVVKNSPGHALADKFRMLPRVWDEKVLAVDDDEIITDIVEAVLSSEASVDTARNGAEALKKMESNYYAAVITDMDMPVMDGISFYKEAVRLYPNIGKRFIFFSGSMRPEWAPFFNGNAVRFLKKPFSIKEIKAAVTEILTAV